MAEHDAYAAWLRERATELGYDLSGKRSGGRTKLAADTGISLSQIARILSGEHRPDIQTQRILAKVLRVPFREMLIRSGTVLAEDLPVEGEAPTPTLPTGEMDLEAVARSYGVPEDKVHLFVTAVKSVAAAMTADESR